jgi:hypothetical protein
MSSTLPAQLRAWAALASQGHVVPAAGGVMFNAAQEIEKMEAALRFYAQSSTYQHMGVQMSGTSTRPCDTDMGTRARSALKGEKKDD